MSGRLQIVPSSTRPPATEPIRVVLADDHAAMRRSLRSVLTGADDIEVTAEVEDLATLLRQVQAEPPRVIVLGGVRDASGTDAISQLRRAVPGSRIVVVTMEVSTAFAEHALGAGAVGVVLKDTADAELPEAVRRAAHGERYTSPRVMPLRTAHRLPGRSKRHIG